MTVDRYGTELEEAVEFLSRRLGSAPPRAVIVGSGLGGPPDGCVVLERIPYVAVPFFPPVSVDGHQGELALVSWEGERFCCARGRVHFYEGFSLSRVVFPARVLSSWGVGGFLLTNAAGAVGADLAPGDLMLIRDHLNLMGDNPLAGPPMEGEGDRFADMTSAYSRRLRDLARRCAFRLGIPLREGVYAAVKGPTYETPAEVRMLRLLGADAVGMSTVPEVIALRRSNREVMALSCLSNRAASVFSDRLEHRHVLQAAAASRDTLWRLLLAILEAEGTGPSGESDPTDRPADTKGVQ
jgi:purine-nucleoside phosphorylase